MLAVEHLYAPPKVESASLRRIRLLSLPFEIAFAALAALATALLVAVVLVGLFYQGENFRLTHGGPTLYLPGDAWPADTIRIADVPLSSRLIGFVVILCIQAPLIAAFVSLSRLFDAYRRGMVFAPGPVRWMQRAGFCLIAFALAPGVFQPVVQAAGLMDRNWFHGHTVAALLIGGGLFVLANVIALGREIQKESEGYI